MKITGMKCAGCRKINCTGCHMAGKFDNGKDKSLMFPGRFIPDEGKGYGIAVDLGTTTIAGLLWDLGKKEQMAAEVCINPGRFAGSDVISRISYVLEKDENRIKMQGVLAEKLDETARKLVERVQEMTEDSSTEDVLCDGNRYLGSEKLQKVVVVGNTVMCEMMLGLSVDGLATAPFHKAYQGAVHKKGHELGCIFLADTDIAILPAIEGYAGADALAVAVYVKWLDERRNVFAVDIGTNGEILLQTEGQTYVCTAAAGPALEGAAVSQGMGAVEGAIEEVKLAGSFPREDIFCNVIGEAAPKGICGSGLVDALAVLKRLGVVDENGYMRSRSEARKAGVREQFCRRITSKPGENAFLLTDEEHPVYLTAKDVRQLQLAKGAIRAGIEILMRKAGLRKEEIAHFYLAGAFGSYIKIESAVEIGLLPDIERKKLSHIGNCAGTGAVMTLLSRAFEKEMERHAEEILHVELAKESEFEECFLSAMAIKKL